MNVLVVGASENVDRYSNRAMRLLKKHGHTVHAVGLKNGKVEDMVIEKEFPSAINNLHTVTLYVGPRNQADLIPKVVALKPKRVIFNPGTENQYFFSALKEANIPFDEACTLVLLNTGQF